VTAVVDAYARDTAGAVRRLRVYAPRRGVTEPLRSLSAWEGRLLALAAVGAGDPDNALGFLQRVRPRSGALWSVMHDPGFDPIRDDPRFVQLTALARPVGARPPVAVSLTAQGARPASSPSSARHADRGNGAPATRRAAKPAEPRTAAAPELGRGSIGEGRGARVCRAPLAPRPCSNALFPPSARSRRVSAASRRAGARRGRRGRR